MKRLLIILERLTQVIWDRLSKLASGRTDKRFHRSYYSVLIIVSLISIPALAQSGGGFDLTWNTFDGGGKVSTGSAFVLKGTAGQADAATLTGGNFIVRGGFWQPPPPPPCLSPTVTGGISSRYIQIEPDTSLTNAVAFRIECGFVPGEPVTEWVQLVQTDYDDGDGVFVNIGTAVADCASADFLTPDEWTNSGANALYVTGLAVAPDSKPRVTAVCVHCDRVEATQVTPANATWHYCDSSNDGQVTFFNDLFKQFGNTGGVGAPFFTGPDPGIEVDTQGDSPSVPDQQVTFFSDIFACFGATIAGGGDEWTGDVCPSWERFESDGREARWGVGNLHSSVNVER